MRKESVEQQRKREQETLAQGLLALLRPSQPVMQAFQQFGLATSQAQPPQPSQPSAAAPPELTSVIPEPVLSLPPEPVPLSDRPPVREALALLAQTQSRANVPNPPGIGGLPPRPSLPTVTPVQAGAALFGALLAGREAAPYILQSPFVYNQQQFQQKLQEWQADVELLMRTKQMELQRYELESRQFQNLLDLPIKLAGAMIDVAIAEYQGDQQRWVTSVNAIGSLVREWHDNLSRYLTELQKLQENERVRQQDAFMRYLLSPHASLMMQMLPAEDRASLFVLAGAPPEQARVMAEVYISPVFLELQMKLQQLALQERRVGLEAQRVGIERERVGIERERVNVAWYEAHTRRMLALASGAGLRLAQGAQIGDAILNYANKMEEPFRGIVGILDQQARGVLNRLRNSLTVIGSGYKAQDSGMIARGAAGIASGLLDALDVARAWEAYGGAGDMGSAMREQARMFIRAAWSTLDVLPDDLRRQVKAVLAPTPEVAQRWQSYGIDIGASATAKKAPAQSDAGLAGVQVLIGSGKSEKVMSLSEFLKQFPTSKK